MLGFGESEGCRRGAYDTYRFGDRSGGGVLAQTITILAWANKALFANSSSQAEELLLSDVGLDPDQSPEDAWRLATIKRCISTVLHREFQRDFSTGEIEIGLEESLAEKFRPSVPDRLVLLRQILRILGDGSRISLPPSLLEGLDSDLSPWGLSLFQNGERGDFLEATSAHDISDEFGTDEDVRWLLDARADCRRQFNHEPPDGVLLRTTSFSAYRSKTQKRAIRHILTSPSRSVFLIALPTGSGKSLFCQLPALHWTRMGNDPTGGLTIMVCPTVALVEDQYLSACTAFGVHDDQVIKVIGDTQPRERQLLLNRIESGAASLAIMTPETVLGYANSSIRKAAEAKNIRMLVIDEAHLIDSWGIKFRPAIQRLSDFRHLLIEKDNNINTVLLSATLKPHTIASIRKLYSSKLDKFHIYNGSDIRREHDYVRNITKDKEERIRFVSKILRLLPRPLILYTTTVLDAEEIYQHLRHLGVKRIRCFTGRTGGNEREEIIRDWRNDRIDIVVATSAFGLGIDKSDVRAIIHATVPESLDRLYQEMGRGGRDGFPCLSWVIASHEDFRLASKHALGNLLTSELAVERWFAMINEGHKVDVPGEIVWSVSPDTRTHRVKKQAERSGLTNFEWNQGTLLLMERAGFIKPLDLVPQYSEAGSHSMNVRILQADKCVRPPEDPGELVEAIEPHREREQKENRRGLQKVVEWLNDPKGACITSKFDEIYALASSEKCGRCWSCRAEGVPVNTTLVDAPIIKTTLAEPNTEMAIAHRLEERIGDFKVGLIEYRANILSQGMGQELRTLVTQLARDGVQQFFSTRQLQEEIAQLTKNESPSLGITRAISELREEMSCLELLKAIPSAIIIGDDLDLDTQSSRFLLSVEKFIESLLTNTRLVVVLPYGYLLDDVRRIPLAQVMTYRQAINAREYLTTLD